MFLKIGPAIAVLDAKAEGLGVAFYWTLTYALYRVMRIYNLAATQYEEHIKEYAALAASFIHTILFNNCQLRQVEEPRRPGHIARYGCEYDRRSTANVFHSIQPALYQTNPEPLLAGVRRLPCGDRSQLSAGRRHPPGNENARQKFGNKKTTSRDQRASLESMSFGSDCPVSLHRVGWQSIWMSGASPG